MGIRPEFRRAYRAEVLSPDQVVLHSESGAVLLTGQVYAQITPLLDGRRSIEEIIDALQDTVAPLHIFGALDRLRQGGYVADAATTLEDERIVWDMLDTPRDVIAHNLTINTVSLHSIGDVDVSALSNTLTRFGVRQSATATRFVVATDDYLRDELLEFARIRLAEAQPWLLCKPAGRELLLGPLFVPGRTGCIECLRDRLRGHRALDAGPGRTRLNGQQSAPTLALPSLTTAAFSILAVQVAKWLARDHNETLEGRIVSLDVSELSQASHRLVRRPQCPLCGDATIIASRQSGPVELGENASDDPVLDSPDAMLERLRHHVSHITGIVRSIHSLKRDDDRLTPVFSDVADHILAERLEYDRRSRAPKRPRSGGKGRSQSEARLSALCESIERYSGVFRGDEARVEAAARELGDVAILPNECMLFSERQFAQRCASNPNASRFDWVPERFEESATIGWTPVWSLSRSSQRLIPTACCFYGYEPDGPVFARANSNGCAAGRSMQDAVLRGTLELIERDSVAIWWYNRLRVPDVDLGSFRDSYIDSVCEHYQRIGREVWVLDVTADIPIPAFAAISRRKGPGPEDVILGFGANPNAGSAIREAIVEMNQSLPAVYPHSPHSSARRKLLHAQALEWWATARIDDLPYLAPSDAQTRRGFSDYETAPDGDNAASLRKCLSRIEDRGLEVCVLDQTRPDTDLTVVRVIVPGLRPFWARFAPGRLFDVPVSIGRLRKPLSEDALNPQSIYF